MSRRTIAATLCCLATLCAPLAPAALATPPAQIAPGAPLRQHADYTQNGLPSWYFDSGCSQGVNGILALPNGRQLKIMTTAAHCTVSIDDSEKVKPGVFVPRAAGDELVGFNHRTSEIHLNENLDPLRYVMHNFDGGDWSTVTVSPQLATSRVSDSRTSQGKRTGKPVVMSKVKDYRRLAPHQVSFDNFGQPICKDGQVSGRSCGTQLFRTNNGVWSYGMKYAHGDSGGNNFNPRTREVIGVSSMSVGPLDRAQPIDYALEQAYGLKDGTVNKHFKLAESTARHDESLRTMGQDDAKAAALLATIPAEQLKPEVDKNLEKALADTNTALKTAAHDVSAAAKKSPTALNKQLAESHAELTRHGQRLGVAAGAVIQDLLDN